MPTTHAGTCRRLICVSVAALGCFAALLGSPQPAEAFPGANGRIAFTSDRTGNDEIFTMNANLTVNRLTRNTVTDHQPAFSADGRRIVFTRSSEATPRST